MKFYFVAAEPSGDVLAAAVISRIKSLEPTASFLGVGGEQMEKQGVVSLFPTKELAVFGLIEGIRAFKTVKEKVEETAKDIVIKDPDAIVLVDSWGFMWRVAKRARELGYKGPRIKLVGPQVWATRPGRSKNLAQHVDHLLCIHDFEVPFYEPFGLPTTVIGNPALERDKKGDGHAFRKQYLEGLDHKVLLLLLGSRSSELKTVAPILEKTAHQLCLKHQNLKVVCVAASSVRDTILDKSKSWTFPHIIIDKDEEKSDAFASADIGLACSGTVTTEAALQGVPLVIGYKVGWITWAIARLFLMKAKFITLFNVAANKEIAKEFIQTRFTSKNLVSAVEKLLSNDSIRLKQISDQNKALEIMGRGGEGASAISAKTILELASKKPN